MQARTTPPFADGRGASNTGDLHLKAPDVAYFLTFGNAFLHRGLACHALWTH